MNKILKQLQNNNSIIIYHHVRPDGDAIFSSLALYEFIKSNFKKKKVYLYGNDTSDLIDVKFNKPSIKVINNSLAIVLDTSNIERADDNSFLSSKYIIKIDHHPNLNPYGNINHVKEDACATAEVLYELLSSKDFKKYKISSKCANYLFKGILTDSLNFKTNSTTSKTLLSASRLMGEYNINIAQANYEVFAKPMDNYLKVTKFRSYLKINKHLGYAIFNLNDLKKIGFNYSTCKNNVDEFNNIKNINIWCVFAYNNKTKLYEGSLRSRKPFVVNKIAQKYNGGGHKYAAAVKNLNKKEIKKLIQELSKIANM